MLRRAEQTWIRQHPTFRMEKWDAGDEQVHFVLVSSAHDAARTASVASLDSTLATLLVRGADAFEREFAVFAADPTPEWLVTNFPHLATEKGHGYTCGRAPPFTDSPDIPVWLLRGPWPPKPLRHLFYLVASGANVRRDSFGQEAAVAGASTAIRTTNMSALALLVACAKIDSRLDADALFDAVRRCPAGRDLVSCLTSLLRGPTDRPETRRFRRWKLLVARGRGSELQADDERSAEMRRLGLEPARGWRAPSPAT
jgi:hypothetical protein